MWGNLKGWIISALMLIAAGGMLVVMAMPPQKSAPAGLVPLAYTPVALPIAADTIEPKGTDPCDAGTFYRQGIEAYLAEPSSYKNAANKGGADLPGVKLVLEAAKCGQMRLFENNPNQAITYNKKPWMDALMALGQATDDAGLYLRDDHPDEAEKYYAAAFALGRNLFDERIDWDEMNKGMSIMTMSAQAMIEIATIQKNAIRSDVLRHFVEQTQQYRVKLQDTVATPLSNPVEEAISTDGSPPMYGSRFAGDVFAVAKNPAADRVWRVEAILHLGHYRFDVADDRKGDQAWASKELKTLQISSDPKNQDVAIKTAVKAAQDLTVIQQRMTGA